METLKSLNPLVIDGVICLVVLIFALIRAKIGLYRVVAGIAIFLVSVAIAFIGSRLLLPACSDFVWEKVSPKIEEKIDATIASAIAEDGTVKNTDSTVGDVLVKLLGIDKAASGSAATGEDLGADFAAKLKTLAMAKAKLLADAILHVILFILIYIVAALILKLISKGLEKVADWSVLGWLNHGGGFLLGLIEMSVIWLAVVRICGLFGVTFFSELSEGTTVLKWLCEGDVAAAISQIKGLTFDQIKNLDLKNLLPDSFDLNSLNPGGLLDVLK